MSLRVTTGKVNKEIKNDRLLLERRLMYYENLLNNMDVEIGYIDQRLKELSEKRTREKLISYAKIDAILEESIRKEVMYKRAMDNIDSEKERKIEQFNGAPEMVTRLKDEIKGLSGKKRRLMVDPLKKQLVKLQGELEKMGVF